MDSPSISIIVPVFNSSEYIDECIGSILDQTMEDFELIIIDDGSMDDSFSKCTSWAERDSRIRLFHNVNHGVSYSRNFGMSKAQGKYLTFIDSDDFVAPTYLEELYNALSTEESISICRINDYCQETGSSEERKEQLRSWASNRDDLYSYLYDIIYSSTIFGSSCRLLFSKKLTEDFNIHFSGCAIQEDQLFFISLLIHCKCINVVDEPLYFYRNNMDSALHRKYHDNCVSDRETYMIALQDILNNCQIKSEEREKLLSFRFMTCYMYIYSNLEYSPHFKEDAKNIQQSIFFRFRKQVPVEYVQDFENSLGISAKIKLFLADRNWTGCLKMLYSIRNIFN